MPGEGVEIGQSPVVVIDVEIERVELHHRQAGPTSPEDIGMHGVAHIEGAIPCGAECLECRVEDGRIGLRDANRRRVDDRRNVRQGAARFELTNTEVS